MNLQSRVPHLKDILVASFPKIKKSLRLLISRKSLPFAIAIVLTLSTALLVAQAQKQQTVKQEAAGAVDQACVQEKCKDRGYCNEYLGNRCDPGQDGVIQYQACVSQNTCLGSYTTCDEKCANAGQGQESCERSCESCTNNCKNTFCTNFVGCGNSYGACARGETDQDIQNQCTTLPGVPLSSHDTECELPGDGQCNGSFNGAGDTISCAGEYDVVSDRSCRAGSKQFGTGICCIKQPSRPTPASTNTGGSKPQPTAIPTSALPACSKGESLGGILKDKPSVVDFKNKLHVFVKGSDDGVYVLHATPKGQDVLWSDWELLGGVLKSNVMTNNLQTTLYVMGTGTDNKMYQRVSVDGISFEDWEYSPLTNPTSIQKTTFNGRTYTFSIGNYKNLCVEQSDYSAPAGNNSPNTGASTPTPSGCPQGNFSCVKYECDACADNNCRAKVQAKYSWATCATSGATTKTNTPTPTSKPSSAGNTTNSCSSYISYAQKNNLCHPKADSSPCCPSGNYSCIKYICDPGDITCSHCVAPWQ